MKNSLFASIIFSLFVILACGPAGASCTTTDTTSGGTKDIQTDCSGSFSKTANPDIIRNPQVLNDKVSDLLAKSQDQEQDIQDKAADQAAETSDAQQAKEDAQARQQDATDRMQDQQDAMRDKLDK